MRSFWGVFCHGCEGYLRGKWEGCLATELQAMMDPCKGRAGLTTRSNRSLKYFVNII